MKRSRTLVLVLALVVLGSLAGLLLTDRPAPIAVERPDAVAEVVTAPVSRDNALVGVPELATPEKDDESAEQIDDAEPAYDDVRGFVHSGEGRTPMPDLSVVAFLDEDVVERTVTAGDGSFRLTLSLLSSFADREAVRVSALAPEGWTQSGGAHLLSKDEAAGTTPVELFVVEAAALPIAGVVTDERTGEPVPAVDVQILCAAGAESVRTDGYGGFVARGAYPSGQVHLTVADGSGDDRVFLDAFDEEHFASAHLRRPLELKVAIGPTYRLDIAGLARANPEPWRFRLTERQGNPQVAGVLVVGNDGNLSLAAGAAEPLDWGSVALRLGPTGAWVRFPRIVHDPDEREPTKRGEPWRAELTSFHPRFRTRTEVAGVIGIDPFLRKPLIRANGVVSGSASSSKGLSLYGMRVELLPAGGDFWHAARPDRCVAFQSGADGAFVFRDVPPGRWKLVVEAADHHVLTKQISVEQGANPLAPITLTAGRFGGKLAGMADISSPRIGSHPTRLLTKRGLELTDANLREVLAELGYTNGLSDARDNALAALAPRWRDGLGPWELRNIDNYQFQFEDLPLEEYDLHIFRESGRTPFARHRVSLPAKHVVVDDDDLDGGRVEIRATVAGSDHLVRALALVYDLGNGVAVARNRSFHGGILGKHAPPWRLWAPGHRPVTGDATDVVSHDGRAVVNVTLRRGWGAALHLREYEERAGFGRAVNLGELDGPAQRLFTHTAVPGVEVLSEHGSSGSSNAHGQVLIDSPAPANRLILLREGWRVRTIERLGTSFDSHTVQEYAVWLSRDNPEIDELRERAAAFDQSHLFAFWDERP